MRRRRTSSSSSSQPPPPLTTKRPVSFSPNDSFSFAKQISFDFASTPSKTTSTSTVQVLTKLLIHLNVGIVIIFLLLLYYLVYSIFCRLVPSVTLMVMDVNHVMTMIITIFVIFRDMTRLDIFCMIIRATTKKFSSRQF